MLYFDAGYFIETSATEELNLINANSKFWCIYFYRWNYKRLNNIQEFIQMFQKVSADF